MEVNKVGSKLSAKVVVEKLVVVFASEAVEKLVATFAPVSV